MFDFIEYNKQILKNKKKALTYNKNKIIRSNLVKMSQYIQYMQWFYVLNWKKVFFENPRIDQVECAKFLLSEIKRNNKKLTNLIR